jgi:hypothetical protein
MDDTLAAHLAAACSRSALQSEAFLRLRDAFSDCKLLRYMILSSCKRGAIVQPLFPLTHLRHPLLASRLSFGLQNKVMLSITINLDREGRTHASYVPIHPTAAAAAVLQNNPVVVVRQDK